MINHNGQLLSASCLLLKEFYNKIDRLREIPKFEEIFWEIMSVLVDYGQIQEILQIKPDIFEEVV